MRKQAEEERQQRAYMRLKALEVKWAEADKVVDAKRDEAYAKAGQVVAGWAERRKLVMDKSEKQDASNADRVAKQYEEKVARVAAWRVKEEERIAKRAAELAAQRANTSQKFKQEKQHEMDRLLKMQQLAEERRLAHAEAKRLHLQDLADQAEARETEMWHRRVKVSQEWERERREVEEMCKAKTKRAEDVHQALLTRIKDFREKEGVWRNPISSLHKD